MKHIINTKILALSCLILLSSCGNQLAERKAVPNPKVAANIIALKDAPEITNEKSKNVLVLGGEKDSVKALDASIKQVKIEGVADTILKKVTKPETRTALDEHLKTGAVALVILKDQIKVLKVTADTSLNLNYDVFSLRYMSRLKALSKASDPMVITALEAELRELKFDKPEKFGLVEITAIKIDKVGTLENERTDYNEKKSLLNVADKPFEMATHIVIGNEVGVEKTADEASEDAE